MPDSVLRRLATLAEAAGKIALEERRRGLRTRSKQGNELVTSAEARIHRQLSADVTRLLPGLGLLTEESAQHAIPDGQYVVIDEIDGTVPYAAGADSWGVMIALIDGSPACGVIHLPERGITITAERGRGCRIDGKRVRTRFAGKLRDCLAGTDVNSMLRDSDWRLIRGLAERVRGLRCLGCAAASALESLTGVTQLYLNPRGGKIWDFAAIAVAVTEAGGVALAPDGAPLQWRRLEMPFLSCVSPQLAEEFLARPPAAGRPRRRAPVSQRRSDDR